MNCVLYFFYYDGRIVLTNGFIKKSQKTSDSEFRKAQAIRAIVDAGIARNLTQKELAERTGFYQVDISKSENETLLGNAIKPDVR